MSFFSPLPLKVPRIAYSVIHQRRASVAQEQYVKTLLELTRQVGERAGKASEEIRAWRDAQAAGALARSSPEIVRKVRNVLQTVCPLPAVEAGLELATAESALPEGRLQELAAAGRQYLTSLGFRTGNGEAPIHESILLFTGSWNYDFIEHIVRDVMGIYEYPHVQHVEELASVIFFTQNEVATIGDSLEGGPAEWQPVILFSKGKPRYDDFRAALGRAMERAVKGAGLRAISLWQRKLGMGNIFEWELRLRCSADPDQLARAVDAFAAEEGAVAERVAARGRLLIYERID